MYYATQPAHVLVPRPQANSGVTLQLHRTKLYHRYIRYEVISSLYQIYLYMYRKNMYFIAGSFVEKYPLCNGERGRAIRCLLSVDCCLLTVDCCLLSVVCWLLAVGCCLFTTSNSPSSACIAGRFRLGALGVQKWSSVLEAATAPMLLYRPLSAQTRFSITQSIPRSTSP